MRLVAETEVILEQETPDANEHINAEIEGLPQKKSSKIVYYLIQAFMSFGENLGYQYYPIFNRKLGATEAQMGLLTAVQNVTKTVFQPFWGKSSDRFGRRRYMLLGAFVAMAAILTMSFAQTPTQVIVSIGFNAFGMSILFPAWQGAIADYTEGRKRAGFMGRILGVSYIYITVSLIGYVFLSPLLPFNEIQQYRFIIVLAAINFGLVAVMSWVLIDLTNPLKSVNDESIFTPLKDKTYRRFLIVILFWWFWMSLAWSYFPLVVSDIILAKPLQVAYIAITATLIQSVTSYKLADYIDRIGERKAINIGFITFTIVPITYAFATEWWHLIPAQLLSGIGIGFGFTAMRSYIIEIGGARRAGNYQGIYQLLWGGVTFTGSILGGFILDWYVDFVGSIGQALTSILLIIAALRFTSNYVIWKFMPDPVSDLPDAYE